MSSWERVARLDSEKVVGELNRQAGVRLVLEGPCPGGQVGAAYVRWDDGRRSVVKWRPGMGLLAMQRGPLTVVEVLRAAGYPVPATELAVQLGDSVVTVQELLPGKALDRWITATDSPDFLSGEDAVHLDFHPGNLLAVDGKITGVIDWDGAARGDRRLDLVTLRFGVHGQNTSVIRRLDAILDTFPDEELRPLWAHMSLRMVDWSIRHFTATDANHWLDLAEQRAR